MSPIKYPENFKNKAKKLRKAGFSYKEISKELKISKSTAKAWSEHIILSNKHKKRLYTKQIKALFKGPNSSHERRKDEVKKIINNAKSEIKFPLSIDSYKLIGAALYWAEGDKTKHFAIANSDPLMIKFMIKWLEDILEIKPERMKAHLNIYPQQNELEIKKFWSDLTKIPLENFGKSFIKPISKKYKKNDLYYGTIKIRVSKGTDIKYRVFGWIKAVLNDIAPDVGNIENKWQKLKTDYKRP